MTVHLIGQNQNIENELTIYNVRFDKVLLRNDSVFLKKKLTHIIGENKIKYKHFFKVKIILDVDSLSFKSKVDSVLYYDVGDVSEEKRVESKKVNSVTYMQFYRTGRESFYLFSVYDKEKKKGIVGQYSYSKRFCKKRYFAGLVNNFIW